MRNFFPVLVVIFSLAAASCSMTSTATEFNGLKDLEGNEIVHVNTTNVGLHWLYSVPLLGDASLEETVSCFTAEALEVGALKTRIVDSDKTTYWWILPPISFFIPLVVTNVAGDAIVD